MKINIIKHFEIYKSVKQDTLQILNEQTDFDTNEIFYTVIQLNAENINTEKLTRNINNSMVYIRIWLKIPTSYFNYNHSKTTVSDLNFSGLVSNVK